MQDWVIELTHDIAGMEATPRKGRNQYEGYLRACGLQFGNLAELCQKDKEFQHAFALTEGRTVLRPINLMNLFLIFKFCLPKLQRGHIVEFGSYRGGSALFMAYLAQRFLQNVNVYALDTFAGMPPTDRQIDAHEPGDFSDVDLEELKKFAKAQGLNNLVPVKGTFQETVPKFLSAAGPVSLVHIDCDIYDSVCYAYESSKNSLVPGGYIVFDDPMTASCLGAYEAVEELIIRRDGLHAEQVAPHLVFRYPKI
jgi:hypothetical protein